MRAVQRELQREQVEWAVLGAWLWLAERKLRRGPAAIAAYLRRRLREYPKMKLPSRRTIARIISANFPDGRKDYDSTSASPVTARNIPLD